MQASERPKTKMHCPAFSAGRSGAINQLGHSPQGLQGVWREKAAHLNPFLTCRWPGWGREAQPTLPRGPGWAGQGLSSPASAGL